MRAAPFVELSLKDNLTAGLRNAGQKLKDFGKGMAIAGGIVSGAGAAILAPLVAMTKQLLETGDQFDKMRQRTGLSVEAISELAHAAEQAGASLVDVETGIRKMQREVGKAGEASLETKDALNALGLSLEALSSMSPEEQFNTIAKAIGDTEDPTKRAALAMQFFGKSGTKLLPMIEDLDVLREEARALGLTMSGETAAGAVKLGDMLANVTKTIKFAGMAVAEALMPALTEATGIVQKIVSAGMKWAKENRGLVTTIAAVGVGLLAAGAAITAFGVASIVAGAALSGLAAIIGAVGAAISLVFSPLGLITAALAAGVYAWTQWTESGRNAVNAITGLLGGLASTAQAAIGGIVDAIRAGDFELAGRIAMTGLQLAFMQGMAAISKAFGGAFGDMLATIGSKIAGGDFAGAWDTAVKGMAALWDGFIEGIIASFTQAARVVVDVWQKAVTLISQFLLELQSGGAGSNVISNVMETELQKLLQRARASGASPEKIAEIERRLAAVRQPGQDLRDMKAQAANVVAGQADSIRGTLDSLDRAAQKRADKSADALKADTAGGVDAADERISALQKQLEDLRAQAASKLAAEQARIKQGAAAGAGEEGQGPLADGGRISGTFSASAAQAMGQGGGVQDRILKTNERQEKTLMEIDKNIIKMERALQMGVIV